MKKIIFAATIFCMMFLQGCMKADVACGIDNEYNVTVKYDVLLDVSALKENQRGIVSDALEEILLYYEDQGFTGEIDVDDAIYSLKMVYQEKKNSYADAFEDLKRVLTDPETSFLSAAELSQESTGVEEAFVFSAKINTEEIFSTLDMEDLPVSLKRNIEEAFEQGDCNFTITLPGTELLEGDNAEIENSLYTLTKHIENKGDTQIVLKTKLNYSDGVIQSIGIEESIDNDLSQQKKYLVFLGIAGFALLVLFVVLVAYIIRTKKVKEEV